MVALKVICIKMPIRSLVLTDRIDHTAIAYLLKTDTVNRPTSCVPNKCHHEYGRKCYTKIQYW